MTPEQAIVADEQTFRVYVVMKLQAISMTCAAQCAADAKRNRWFETVGKMLLQSLLTGGIAVGLALLTLHMKG